MLKESKLAINGGQKVVPDGFIKDWPPIDDIDRQYVLDSLQGTKHDFGWKRFVRLPD